jgi:hypothetical protein
MSDSVDCRSVFGNGRDILRRHHRTCPGDPDAEKRGAHRIGMAGTGPAMTAEGVTKAGSGRRPVQREGGCGTKEGVTQDSAMPHRVITVPARSSPALGPSDVTTTSDVITGLVPVIPIA